MSTSQAQTKSPPDCQYCGEVLTVFSWPTRAYPKIWVQAGCNKCDARGPKIVSTQVNGVEDAFKAVEVLVG